MLFPRTEFSSSRRLSALRSRDAFVRVRRKFAMQIRSLTYWLNTVKRKRGFGEQNLLFHLSFVFWHLKFEIVGYFPIWWEETGSFG
jgi:hypothetical protein